MEKKTDLRIERTYMFLHNSFTSLLEEKRFEEITVNELCDRAMIRRTTFYKHFANKYEYFIFYMKEICETFNDQLPENEKSSGTGTYLLSMCSQLLKFLSKHEKLVINALDSDFYSLLLDSLSEQIIYDVGQVLRKDEIYSHMSARELDARSAFYAGGLINTFRHLAKSGLPVDEDIFMKTVKEFLETL